MQALTLYQSKKIKQSLPTFVSQGNIIQKKKIILISPHSDDVAIAFGGFAALLARTNHLLPLLFFSGFRGLPKIHKEDAIKIRQTEMQKETRVLGLSQPIFLNLSSYESSQRDILLKDQAKLKEIFLKEKPDIIFLPKQDDVHPSHCLATDLTISIAKQIRMNVSLFFYENPWSLFKADEINTIFMLDKKSLKIKKRGILCHQSQIQRTDFLTAAFCLSRFRAVTLPEQIIFGFGGRANDFKIKHLEVFKNENLNF